MMRMRLVPRVLVLAALAAATTSCGNVVRDSRSPAYLIMDSLTAAASPSTTFSNILNSDVITLVTSGGTCSQASPCPTVFSDNGSVVLRLALKDVGTTASPTTPTTNNEMTMTRYHVDYFRTDGRNTPGVDIPYSFDGAATGTVPATGTLTLGFELVRSVAKQEGPLVQYASNPGVLTVLANVTFYGTDRVGNDVSVTGTIQINFANWGDA